MPYLFWHQINSQEIGALFIFTNTLSFRMPHENKSPECRYYVNHVPGCRHLTALRQQYVGMPAYSSLTSTISGSNTKDQPRGTQGPEINASRFVPPGHNPPLRKTLIAISFAHLISAYRPISGKSHSFLISDSPTYRHSVLIPISIHSFPTAKPLFLSCTCADPALIQR